MKIVKKIIFSKTHLLRMTASANCPGKTKINDMEWSKRPNVLASNDWTDRKTHCSSSIFFLLALWKNDRLIIWLLCSQGKLCDKGITGLLGRKLCGWIVKDTFIAKESGLLYYCFCLDLLLRFTTISCALKFSSVALYPVFGHFPSWCPFGLSVCFSFSDSYRLVLCSIRSLSLVVLINMKFFKWNSRWSPFIVC